LAGEIAVFEEYPENSIIIRTAWLYSAYGKNFYKTILKLALRNSDPINVVNDQFGQPTHACDLAQLAFSATDRSVPAGIYHGSNSGSTNWHNFAVEIFRLAGADTDRVKEISSRDYISGVSRPEYSVLDNSKWLDLGIEPLGSWQESVSRAFPAILESLS
jgi:dTDP-4-dehydrorhamnose reductase